MSNTGPDTHSVVENTIGELGTLPITARIIAIEALNRVLPSLLEAARETQTHDSDDSSETKTRMYVL